MLRKLSRAAVCAATAAVAVFTFTGPAAHATTATCTNIAHPVAAPVGCGGVYLPLLGSGTQPDGTSLTLTAADDFWNGHVTVQPYDPASSAQDFTVFEVCSAAAPPPPAGLTDSCGPGTNPVTDPLSGQAEFVAEATPDGQHLGASHNLNDPGNLCLSVERVTSWIRGHRAARWRTVLRTCNTGGASFTAGSPSSPPSAGNGTGGSVTSPNPWQTWSPVPADGGYVLANNELSNGYHTNTPFVLDDTGGGGPGTWLTAYQETDQPNQVWKVIGCTNPVTSLTPGFYNCP